MHFWLTTWDCTPFWYPHVSHNWSISNSAGCWNHSPYHRGLGINYGYPLKFCRGSGVHVLHGVVIHHWIFSAKSTSWLCLPRRRWRRDTGEVKRQWERGPEIRKGVQEESRASRQSDSFAWHYGQMKWVQGGGWRGWTSLWCIGLSQQRCRTMLWTQYFSWKTTLSVCLLRCTWTFSKSASSPLHGKGLLLDDLGWFGWWDWKSCWDIMAHETFRSVGKALSEKLARYLDRF